LRILVFVSTFLLLTVLSVTSVYALAGFSNSVPFRCESDKVGSDLTDFPVRLVLGGTVGIYDDDLTIVFDEIGADFLKLAVTDSDDNQCYVEVAYWDSGSESAELYFKAPLIESGTDTLYYLHFDAGATDNTSYVGTPNSVPATNVWDSNYVAVYHFTETVTGTDTATFIESTGSGSNGYCPGTSFGGRSLSLTSRMEGWLTGKSQYVSGSSMCIVMPFIDNSGTYTIETIVHTGTFPSDYPFLIGAMRFDAGVPTQFVGCWYDDRVDPLLGDIRVSYCTDYEFFDDSELEDYICEDGCDGWPKDEWTSLAFIRGGSIPFVGNMRIYNDGELVTSGTYYTEDPPTTALDLEVGFIVGVESYWIPSPDDVWVTIDEFRYSDIDRGGTWMYAAAASYADDFVNWFSKPDVTTVSAVFGSDLLVDADGLVSGLGGSTVVEYGFVYSLTGTPSLGSGTKSSVVEAKSSVPFSFGWDIDVDKPYPPGAFFVRAFATNDYTTGYGAVLSGTAFPSLGSGTLVLWLDFEPEDANSQSVDDLSGRSNNLRYNWFDPWLDCLSGTGSVSEDSIASETIYQRGEARPSATNIFDVLEPPDTMYQEGEGEGLPLYELFGWTATYLDWGTGMLYMFVMMMAGVGVGLGATIATGSPMFGALGCGFVLAAGMTTGIVPLWLIIVYGLFTAPFILVSKGV